MHPIAFRQLTDADIFKPAISADTFIELHLRLLLHAPSGRETLVGSRTVRPQGLLEGGATSDRRNGSYRGQIKLSYPMAAPSSGSERVKWVLPVSWVGFRC